MRVYAGKPIFSCELSDILPITMIIPDMKPNVKGLFTDNFYINTDTVKQET